MIKSDFSLLFDNTIPMFTTVQVLNCTPEFLTFLSKKGVFRSKNARVQIYRNKAFQGRFLKMAYGKVYLTGFQERNACLYEPVTISFLDIKEAQLFRSFILDAILEYTDRSRDSASKEGNEIKSSCLVTWSLTSA